MNKKDYLPKEKRFQAESKKKSRSQGRGIKEKNEIITRKRKHGTRKKMKSRKRRFKQDTSQDDPSDIEKENDELRLCLTIATDEDKGQVASDDLRGALSVTYLLFAHSRRSVSIRCQGYIGDFVLGCHAKDMVVLLIIMAQQQHAADVHPDELCPLNKRYDLMDANKNVDLEQEDGSKYRLKFMLDKKELTLTLDDFRTIFHLPQATDNNHYSFVPPPSFSDMVPFYKQVLGFTMDLKTSSSFKTTGLLQPWQTLCKIFSKCLTTPVTGWDQPPLQIMQMMTPSAPRSPNPNKEAAESSALRRSTVIRLCIPERRSTRLTPPAPVPNVDKADEMILQDTLQVSLVEHKSHEEQEARENVALVDEHLASEEIEKMVDGQENVVDDSSIPRNDESNIPGTRIEPRSNKESPKV
ncbi:hypothetical protein Tco_0409787 [Tanacetum coccineum]